MKESIRVIATRSATLFVLVVCALTLFAAKPELVFNTSSVAARGITKGGTAIWFVGSVEPFNGSLRLSHALRVTVDEDRDRNVVLELPINRYSAVVVVDAATGDFESGRADGSAMPAMVDRSLGNAWQRDARFLDFVSSDACALLVRPDVGAWLVRAAQGTRTDADGLHDATLRVALDRMTPLWGTAPAPPVALPRDLLIVVDLRQLTLFGRMAKEKE